MLKRDKQMNAALIIAPKRVMSLVWPDEVASLPVDQVLRAWQIHAEMTPKERK